MRIVIYWISGIIVNLGHSGAILKNTDLWIIANDAVLENTEQY